MRGIHHPDATGLEPRQALGGGIASGPGDPQRDIGIRIEWSSVDPVGGAMPDAPA